MTGTHRAKVTNAHLVMIYRRVPSAFRKAKLAQATSLEQHMGRWVSFASVTVCNTTISQGCITPTKQTLSSWQHFKILSISPSPAWTVNCLIAQVSSYYSWLPTLREPNVLRARPCCGKTAQQTTLCPPNPIFFCSCASPAGRGRGGRGPLL